MSSVPLDLSRGQSSSIDPSARGHDWAADPWAGSAHKGLLPDEFPFRPDLMWLAAGDVVAALALSAPPAGVTTALSALIANLAYLALRGSGVWLFYSRDRNHYAGAGPYCPPYYTRTNMVRAVALLEAAGLIEHWKTAPSPTPNTVRGLSRRARSSCGSAAPSSPPLPPRRAT
jgi:hypothetical protein